MAKVSRKVLKSMFGHIRGKNTLYKYIVIIFITLVRSPAVT